MSSKGKQISVIIAGATGSTGREIVSRLVSHPDVSRVVALARYPIPVNRWTAVFPHLHAGDARRYLSVVPVDWEKILADASRIPRSYVTDGVWRFDDAEAEWRRYEWHCRRTYRLSRAYDDADAAFRSNAGVAAMTSGESAMSAGASTSSSSSSANSSLWASMPPQGYIKVPAAWSRAESEAASRRTRSDSSSDILEELRESDGKRSRFSSTLESSLSAASSSSKLSRTSDAERRRWSQEFLHQLVQNNFYRSVFAGHQVAINCLGTAHVLSSAELTLVDYDLSIAFAKMVRLFNSMAHAEPTDDEERLLVEATSRELDSVLWNEIYAACYGKTCDYDGRIAAMRDGVLQRDTDKTKGLAEGKAPDDHAAPRDAAEKQRTDVQWMNRGQVATLRHFSQVSVRGANERSPFAYLRTQGRRDNALLRLFNRWDDRARLIARGAFIGRLQSKTSIKLGLPPLVSPAAAPHSAVTRVLQWPQRVFFGAASSHPSYAVAKAAKRADSRGRSGAPMSKADAEAVARRRAQMLLRRDVVKLWEQANLTIWRPGVFARSRRRRWLEWVIALFERPVDVKCLAECIVDDIVESFYHSSGNTAEGESGGGRDNERPPRVGRTKIINGSSVARRTYMKALEDGLDERDTRRARRGHK